MDKFPEAFQRFEQVVDTRRIRSFRALLIAFKFWSGRNWQGSKKQMLALAVEAQKRGIPIPIEIRRRYKIPPMTVLVVTQPWRREIILVKGRLQQRFRDLRSGRFIKKPKGG
jgi:hypothetical protein